MISPMYLVVVVFMAIYTNTEALQPTDAGPLRCYQCSGPTCEQSPLQPAVCPTHRPHCATVAAGPNFTSSLTCTAAASEEKPCSLTYSVKQIYELTCVCSSHLCNAPFSREFQQELINFSSANKNNMTDLTEVFWKQSHFGNFNEKYMYKNLSTEMREATGTKSRNASEFISFSTASTSTTMRIHVTEFSARHMPSAEALKQETTVASEDDEDEGEGSGAEEERRQSAAAAAAPDAPAAPSSYLPAEDSSAPPLFNNLLAGALALFFILL